MIETKHLIAAAALVAATACAVDPDDRIGTIEQASGEEDCAEHDCGGNAASMGIGISFHDAHKTLLNDAGVRLVGFRKAGQRLELAVEGDELVGWKGSQKLQQLQLSGARLVFARGDDTFVVRIGRPATSEPGWKLIEFWAVPQERISAYQFVYHRLGPGEPIDNESVTDWAPLCAETLAAGDRETTQYIGDAVSWAIVFAGDRYDAATKTVSTDPARVDGWFNIACLGTAVAKMHLFRYSEAGTPLNQLPTTQLERQALLKAITGDECGTGHSFTHDGHQVGYMDRRGWVHPFDVNGPDIESVESLWTAQGARCLDEPRLEKEEGHEIVEAIRRECGGRLPPTCTSILHGNRAQWTHVAGVHAITVNPRP